MKYVPIDIPPGLDDAAKWQAVLEAAAWHNLDPHDAGDTWKPVFRVTQFAVRQSRDPKYWMGRQEYNSERSPNIR